MKKIITAFLGLLLFGVAPFAIGNQLKVGVIDLPQIMQRAPQVKAINQKLKTEFSEQQKIIMSAQQQLQADTLKLQSNKPMQTDERKQLQDKVSGQQKNLQQMVVSFQQKVSEAQNKALEQLMNDINSAVKSIAQKQQLDIVLLKPAVVYASNTVDVTDQVIKQLPNK